MSSEPVRLDHEDASSVEAHLGAARKQLRLARDQLEEDSTPDRLAEGALDMVGGALATLDGDSVEVGHGE